MSRRPSFSMKDNAASTLNWVQAQIAPLGVTIPDGAAGWTNAGWKNGKIWCAILANYFPEKINFKSLSFTPENAQSNLELAWRVRNEVGIWACIEGLEDVADWDKKVYVPELQFWHQKLSTLSPVRDYSASNSLPLPSPSSPARPLTPPPETSPKKEIPIEKETQIQKSPISSPVSSNNNSNSATPVKETPSKSSKPSLAECPGFEPVHPQIMKTLCKHCNKKLDEHPGSDNPGLTIITQTPPPTPPIKPQTTETPPIRPISLPPPRDPTPAPEKNEPKPISPTVNTSSSSNTSAAPPTTTSTVKDEIDDAEKKRTEKIAKLQEQIRLEKEEKKRKEEEKEKELQKIKIQKEKEAEKEKENQPDLFGRKNLRRTSLSKASSDENKPVLDRGSPVLPEPEPVDTSSISNVKKQRAQWDQKVKEQEQAAREEGRISSTSSSGKENGTADYRNKPKESRDCCTKCIIC